MKIKHKRTKHTAMYTTIKKNGTERIFECDKRKSYISSKLHMICMSSNDQPRGLVVRVCGY